MVWLKLLGLLLMALGVLIIRYFPDITEYQRPEFLRAGLFLGAVLFVAGLALLIFG
jgi:hypothetical protein